MASTPSNGNQELVAKVVAEWRECPLQGEHFEVHEYTTRYPAIADELRELFPAMVMIEDLKGDVRRRTGSVAAGGILTEGKTLERLGDFRILREIGRGGMGVVYEAEQVSLGRHVALKVLPPQAAARSAAAEARFEREARAAARLHHTNIVPVFGVGEQDGLPYYVMQFIQGLGLDEVLDELKQLQRARTARTPACERPLRARARTCRGRVAHVGPTGQSRPLQRTVGQVPADRGSLDRDGTGRARAERAADRRPPDRRREAAARRSAVRPALRAVARRSSPGRPAGHEPSDIRA